jgi:hypothetical protein
LGAALCLQEFVEQASGALVGLYAELIGAVLPNISHPNPDIQQVSLSCKERITRQVALQHMYVHRVNSLR